MRTFRLLLTFLLCLTVPMAGLASVLSGPLCPQSSQASAPAMSHEHADDATIAPHAGAAGHHQHYADPVKSGKPCKGEHRGCGCGMGACSASTLALTTPFSALLAMYVGKQAVPTTDDVPHAGARGTSPLRPPIV